MQLKKYREVSENFSHFFSIVHKFLSKTKQKTLKFFFIIKAHKLIEDSEISMFQTSTCHSRM